MFKRVVLLFLVVGALVACSSSERVTSADGPTPTEDGESRAERAQDDPEPDDQSSPTTKQPESTASESSGAEPATSSFLAVFGPVTIPDGPTGELSVVMVGDPYGGSVPVVVRNRTDETLYNVAVSGTVRDAEGALLGSGQDQGLEPVVVGPGEWAFGYVYMGLEDLPSDSQFDLTATAETDAGFVGSLSATIVEHNVVEGSYGTTIVGILRNGHDQEMGGPILVMVGCFTSDGSQLTSTQMSFADQDSIPSEATASFSVDLYDAACPAYVIGASGYDF